MSVTGKSIIIVGGGIGGLGAALALLQRGAQVTVLEQAPEISEIGAGIQISPNGFAVLRALGLGDAARAAALPLQRVQLCDGLTGRSVAVLDLAKYRPDQSYLAFHRADLIDLLAKSVRSAGGQIRLLQLVQDVDPTEGTLRTNCGASFKADIIIGADGLHSAVRAAVTPPQPPFFTGQVAWRAIVPNTTNHPNEARVWMGPKRHVVTYPLRGGAFLNIVAVLEQSKWVDEGWSIPDTPDNLRSAFSECAAQLQDILAQVVDLHLWGLFRHPIAQNWHKGRCAIIGDAAHPTLPFLAQGANMALEDAWVFADALATQDTFETAFAVAQSRRLPRVTRAIKTANGNAWKYHISAPPLRKAAHLSMKLLSTLAPQRLIGQFDWLYNHDVTKP